MHMERNWKLRAPDRLDILSSELYEKATTAYAFEGHELPDDQGMILTGRLLILEDGLAFLTRGESAKRSAWKGAAAEGAEDLVAKIAVPQLLLIDGFGAAVTENPCVKMATGEAEPHTAPVLEAVSKPVGQALRGAGEVVKGTGEVAKDAAGAVLKGAGALLRGAGNTAKGLIRRDQSPGEEEQPLLPGQD